MTEPPALSDLRERLDTIDVALLERLRERLACCAEVARVKAAHRVPMMAPARIGLVQRRAAAFADRHAIDPHFLRRLYDLVIAETCRIEDAIIAERSEPCAPS